MNIEPKLLEEFRTSFDTIVFNFPNDVENKPIVRKEFEHEQIIFNHSVNDFILDVYYFRTQNLMTDNEFEIHKKRGLVGKKERILFPYSVIVNGAYCERSNLIFKINSLEQIKNNGSTERHKNIKSFNDLDFYFIEYAKGFKYGYENFISEKIEPFLPLGYEKTDFASQIFDFFLVSGFMKNSWYSYKWFTVNQNGEIIEGYKDGQQEGYIYKAWSIIFANSQLFEPLFKKIEPSPKRITTFTDCLKNIDKKEAFAQSLKEKFTDLKGKKEAAFVFCLNDSRILKTDVSLKKIHEVIKTHFDKSNVSKQSNNLTRYLTNDFKEKNKLEMEDNYSTNLTPLINDYNEIIGKLR